MNSDFNRVDRIQRDILAEYRDDISKHAKGKEKQLVRMCYDAIPKQLAKEQKKFQYSTVEKGKTRRKYGGSVQWLVDSAMVHACYNIREPYLPLICITDHPLRLSSIRLFQRVNFCNKKFILSS